MRPIARCLFALALALGGPPLGAQDPKATLAAKVARVAQKDDCQVVAVYLAPSMLADFARIGGATEEQAAGAAAEFKPLEGYLVFLIQVVQVDESLTSQRWTFPELTDRVRLAWGGARLAPLKTYPTEIRLLVKGLKDGMNRDSQGGGQAFELLVFPEVPRPAADGSASHPRSGPMTLVVQGPKEGLEPIRLTWNLPL